VIVGGFNVLRMLWAQPDNPLIWVAKAGMIPFFIFHYGMFTTVHGAFVLTLFGGVHYRGLPGPTAFWRMEEATSANRLDSAGFQNLGLIALLRGADVSSPQTRQRVESLASHISQDPAVGRIADYYTTGSRDFVSADGHATYLAVDLKPHDDKARQDAAKRLAQD